MEKRPDDDLASSEEEELLLRALILVVVVCPAIALVAIVLCGFILMMFR